MAIQDIIKQGIQTVTSYRSWVDSHANNFIVKPLAAKGIGGFEFSIRDTDRVEFRSDITDYVVEDNKAVQDHIAIKPMMITLRGFIGEVVKDVQPAKSLLAVGFLEERLVRVPAFNALYTLATTQAQSRAFNESDDVVSKIDAAINASQNIVDTLGLGTPGETVQERAFSNLRALFQSRQIITVETPWGYVDRMAITSLVFEQDPKTRSWSDVSVTLKQLSFATTVIAQLSQATRSAEKWAELAKLGKIKGDPPASLEAAPWQQVDGTVQPRAWDAVYQPTGTGVE